MNKTYVKRGAYLTANERLVVRFATFPYDRQCTKPGCSSRPVFETFRNTIEGDNGIGNGRPWCGWHSTLGRTSAVAAFIESGKLRPAQFVPRAGVYQFTPERKVEQPTPTPAPVAKSLNSAREDAMRAYALKKAIEASPRIVRESYDELVAALRGCLARLDRYQANGTPEGRALTKVREAARAALAKAEGGSK